MSTDPQTNPTTKKHGPGSTGILIIFIFAILLSGGILYWQKSSRQNSANQQRTLVAQLFGNPETTSSAEPSPASEAEIDTSTWETYFDDTYGFEIAYPGSWHIDLYENRVRIIPSQEESEGSFDIIFEPLQDIPGYPDKWQNEKQYAAFLNESSQEVTIGDHQWLEIVHKNGEKNASKWLFIIKDDRLVQLSLWSSGSKDVYRILNHMVSTFAFVQ